MKFYRYLAYVKKSKVSTRSKIFPFSRVTSSFIDDYSYVAYNCIINNCSIGRYCSIAQGVKIGLGTHPTNFISTSPIFYSPSNPLNIEFSPESKFNENSPVTIGNDVWIGSNAIILDGITISDGAIIAANSVVTKNVMPYEIVGGVPAKLIKTRFNNSIIEKLLKIKWWDLSIDEIKSKNIYEEFTQELDLELTNKIFQKIS